jgi:hypothetical protein
MDLPGLRRRHKQRRDPCKLHLLAIPGAPQRGNRCAQTLLSRDLNTINDDLNSWEQHANEPFPAFAKEDCCFGR